MPKENGKISVVIVDDESLAREKIRLLLSKERDFEIVAECADAKNAIVKIKMLKPRLIFLDIQMPGMDGFEMLKQLKMKNRPVIIFTTAYDKYAIKAFDIYALDYLLKPFDKERFHLSLQRTREHLSGKNAADERIIDLLTDLSTKKGLGTKKPLYDTRMIIRQSGRIFFLKINQIEYIEASGNYMKIHSNDESYLLRDTLNAMEKKLDPENFIRIHRSVIVNIEFIKEIKPWFNGEYLVFLKNGTKLTSSKTYKNNFLKLSTA